MIRNRKMAEVLEDIERVLIWEVAPTLSQDDRLALLKNLHELKENCNKSQPTFFNNSQNLLITTIDHWIQSVNLLQDKDHKITPQI